MKKLLLLFVILFAMNTAKAQDYLGLSTGNYSGIHGLQLQPASVADNRYKFEINLFSTDIGFQSNYLGFSRDFFLKNRFSLKDFDTYKEFQENVLTENKNITGNQARFNLSNRLNLPSLLLTTGKKSGIAIGFQSRTGIAVDNLNVGFARQLYTNFQDATNYNKVYSLDGLNMNALNWVEANFTYGRVLIDNGKHFLKAGATAKYLGGVSSWYLDADQLDLAVNNDSTMTTYNGGSVNFGHSESDFSGAQLSNFEPDAHGFGFDAGLVYEFRGRINKFKVLKLNKNDEEFYTSTRRDKNKYSFKVGVSLLDAGQLSFKSAAQDFTTTSNSFILKNAGIKNVQDLDRFMDSTVGVQRSGAIGDEFSVAMPTALSGQFDLHLYKGFYVNAMAYVPFDGLNKSANYRVFTPNYYAVTPRWESRAAGLYVPIVLNNNYNDDKQLSAGATLRVGPLFVGTSNMLTLFKKEDIQSANVHFGLKVPVAHGKPSKAAKWFKNFTNEKEETSVITNEENNTREEKVIENNEIIIDKKEEIIKEKAAPKTQPIQIIINNYNTAGKKTNTQEIIEIDPTTGEKTQRTITTDEQSMTGESLQFSNLQEQIEYLKFKLKQKETLINELEKEQERVKSGGSNEAGKKKIDSLKNDYLNNNNFNYNGAAWDTSSSVVVSRARVFELQKELISLEAKNAGLEKKMAQLEQVNKNEMAKATNDLRLKRSLQAVDVIVKDVRENEVRLSSPSIVYSHLSPGPNYENQKKTSLNSPNNTKLDQKDIVIIPSKTNGSVVNINTENLMTKKDAQNLMSKTEYQNLQDELKKIRTELNNNSYSKTEKQPRRKWRLFGGGTSKNTVVPVVAPINNTVQIVRDTIYIEKEVEKIVTQIVRDTITNTIEKNNTITKTETEIKEVKVEVDNTLQRLIERPAYFVLFASGSAEIQTVYKNELNFYAKQIKAYPDLKLNLTGHADATGNAAANLALSKTRAQQVRNYLIQKGVNKEKISIDFSGDQDPLETNQTNVGKSQNRRVEVLFVK